MSFQESLETRIKKIEADFQKTTERAKALVDKRADVQKQLSEVDRELAGVRDEQLGLQRAHQELKSLVEVDAPPSKGTETIN